MASRKRPTVTLVVLFMLCGCSSIVGENHNFSDKPTPATNEPSASPTPIAFSWLPTSSAACDNKAFGISTIHAIPVSAQAASLSILNGQNIRLFASDYTVQSSDSVGPELIMARLRDAETIADLLSSEEMLLSLCGSNRIDQEDCLSSVASQAARHVLRRPISTGEVDRLNQTFVREGSNVEAAKLALVRLLLSPEAFYRTELGTTEQSTKRIKLTPYEHLSRISFLLRGHAPKVEWVDKITTGQWSLDIDIEQVYQTIAAASEHKDHLKHFYEKWLHIEQLDAAVQSATGDKKALLADFATEAKMRIDYLIENRLGVRELLNGKTSFLNARLRAHFGLEPIAEQGFLLTDIPAGRRSWLQQGAF